VSGASVERHPAEREGIDQPRQSAKRFGPCPKHIKFVTELPMNGVGKVDKKVLKAGFWVGRGRMVG
jgi:fatty-acyl-CoA synthase